MVLLSFKCIHLSDLVSQLIASKLGSSCNIIEARLFDVDILVASQNTKRVKIFNERTVFDMH